MKDKILSYLKREKKGADVHQMMDYFGFKGAFDFKELMKALNRLEDDDLIYRDTNDVYHDLSNYEIKEGTVILRYNGTAFIEKETGYNKIIDLNGALHKDVVWYINGKSGLYVIKVIKRNTDTVIGTIYRYRHTYHFRADDERLKGFKITNFKSYPLKDKIKVRCIITDYHKKEMKIEKTICSLDDPRCNELSIVYGAHVPLEFSPAVLKEADRLVMGTDMSERRDLTNELTITIDGESAKDFDDAISIRKDDKGYILKVHIADVSYFVKEGSAIDKSAKERGTSIYYTDQVIPMLPEKLCNDLCSLVEGKERYALTVEIHYDLKADVIDTDFYPSIIKSDHRMTYTAVNKILNGDKKTIERYPDLIGFIAIAKELSDLIKAKRKKAGAISFDDDEAMITLDDEGRVIDVKRRERGVSEGIIEDLMIEANVAVASYMHYLDYPMIYRVHDRPKEDKIKIFFEVLEGLGYKIKGDHYMIYPKQLQEVLLYFKNKEEESVISKLLLRSMAKALYDDVCMGHFGLALSDYCHFTSPIRRYPDLMVHRMLRRYVFKADLTNYEKDKKRMHDIAVKCSDAEKRATQIERDVEEVRKAEYMQDHIGEVYKGIVSGVTERGIYVKLENTIEGLLAIEDLDGYFEYDEKMMTLRSTDKVYRLGDRVTVEVTLDLNDRPGVRFILYG